MNDNTPNSPEKQPVASSKKPDESGGFYISTHIKITDPNTKEILVQKRGDS